MYGYENYYQQMPRYQAQQQQQSNGLIWVQGEAGAKSYMVAPGQSVLLMDSENQAFYIKSADASGMPLPLRVFDYSERTSASVQQIQNPAPQYITREEFEKRLSEIMKGENKDESIVSTVSSKLTAE